MSKTRAVKAKNEPEPAPAPIPPTAAECCCGCLMALSEAAMCLCCGCDTCGAAGDEDGTDCCQKSFMLVLEAMELHIQKLKAGCPTMGKSRT